MKRPIPFLRRLAPALALAVAAAFAPGAAQAAWPGDGTIKMIAAYAPGGGYTIGFINMPTC